MLADQFAAATVSFARDAQPRLEGGRAWPVYQPGTATSLRWGEGSGDAVLGGVPKLAQLAVWDGMVGY